MIFSLNYDSRLWFPQLASVLILFVAFLSRFPLFQRRWLPDPPYFFPPPIPEALCFLEILCGHSVPNRIRSSSAGEGSLCHRP